MNRQQRRSTRWDRHPSKLTRKRVRTILVDDALAGVPTPIDWTVDAYLYLGRGAEGAEHEFISVRDEVRARGGVMPDAPLS